MSEGEKSLFDSSKMLYRYSLNPGLQASVLNFPFMLHENIENMKEILKICFQNYINFFEAVEFYDLLSSEKTFVQTLKELNVPSEKIVVLPFSDFILGLNKTFLSYFSESPSHKMKFITINSGSNIP